jgi:hypothetical protein
MKKILLATIAASFILLLSSCEVEVRDGHHYHHHAGWEHAHHPEHHEVYNHGYHHDGHGAEIEVHTR